MLLRRGKYGLGLLVAVALPFWGKGQLMNELTQPWSYSVNYTFGRGITNPGAPISGATSDLAYTTEACPLQNQYAISNAVNCPGMPVPPLKQGGYEMGAAFFYGYAQQSQQPPGYMMLASYGPSPVARLLFSKTVTGLCSNRDYLFWAAIRSLIQSTCIIPDLTFQVETLAGTVIQSWSTGPMGQAGDSAKWYIGFYNPMFYPQTPFYGQTFRLPAGISDIVLKIIIPPVDAYKDCRAGLAIDNIELTPMGPDVLISIPGSSNGYQAGACYLGNVPLSLNAQVLSKYALFGSPDSVAATFDNPQVQWQQSLDTGFTWQDIPGETGLSISHVFHQPDTFYVRVRAAGAADIGNLYCNVVSNIIRVDVDSLPTGIVFSSNSPVCEDGDLIFDLEGGARYITTGPNGYFDDIAKPQRYHPSLADSGWYYVQVTSFGGCPVVDSTHVIVRGPAVRIGGDQTICYGQPAQLEVSGGTVYSWTPMRGLSDPASASPLASPPTTTQYQVKVSDTSGCSAYASVTVHLRDTLLEAAFTAPDVACPQDIVAFRNGSKGKLTAFSWDFGNGSSSTDSFPPDQSYAYASEPVNYTVRLVVTDTSGCMDTATHIVKSVNNCFIGVPSGFTPNGDGHNDYLYPLNAWKASDLHFRVFNRNGEMVFETEDWTKKWDGRAGGKLQPPGVYVWTLEYTDEHGARKVTKGTTMLIR
ncbi:MAG TPA: gliding motility-associated C-terminal domain-containing protein [Puia sp.]|nr:gliding motility-associated C-terminal domain-containing protein [Puia sp.]